ncbi:GAF domain-containing sensor histidine kinase [Candidatus Roizmanbacteria bacterium]|nr:GAF domain-containing sensor histidine kinase [Candidatus Roizmanbacteria bacterium]
MKLFGLFSRNSVKTEPQLTSDASHINQEMYKKSAELNERNKTLSLLQKLNSIVLGSITHLNEIAQLVTSLLVGDGGFENVTIFLFDGNNKQLQRLAFSEPPKSLQIPYFIAIPLSQTTNLVVQSVNEKVKKTASSPENILLASSDFANPEIKQALIAIKSVHIFPLVVRNELIGVLVIALAEEESNLSEYKRDLLTRLSDSIGIGIDNSLLYNEVQAANERLKQLDKLKDEFVSVASHELRTPMTAVKSYLWMTLDGRGGELTEKQKFYLERAYTSVDRLIRLVNDMLNVSRIDSGRIDVILKAVDLKQLVREVFEEVMPKAKELRLDLVMNPDQVVPQALADADKIKEVLFNLIGNSLKFTPQNGSITVSFAQKGNMLETTVADTGTGIEAADIPKLFTKFSMIANSYMADRPIQGTGLGLYISKSIVELHGGKIWAISAGSGKGTQFTFSLKIPTQEDLDQLAKNPPDEQKPMIDIIHTDI